MKYFWATKLNESGTDWVQIHSWGDQETTDTNFQLDTSFS